ncbi:OsmC family protein [Streptomyces sp. NPDC001848]|uniref:OsmC family protein n=1 Tax=Streptomyces sp. NPDC001848 TaxID=3364618 RepID=UPI003673FBC5
MNARQRLAEGVRTRRGRTVTVSGFTPQGMPANMGRVVLGITCEPRDRGETLASLTPEEARRVAGLLLHQAAVFAPRVPGPPGHADAVPITADAYEVRLRGHILAVDQPVPDGGTDTAPTPVELLVASLTACVAHCAGRFLDRHDLSREGLRIETEFRTASGRAPRVTSLRLRVRAPALPAARRDALRSVVSRCTVRNTLTRPPEIVIALPDDGIRGASPASPADGRR